MSNSTDSGLSSVINDQLSNAKDALFSTSGIIGSSLTVGGILLILFYFGSPVVQACIQQAVKLLFSALKTCLIQFWYCVTYPCSYLVRRNKGYNKPGTAAETVALTPTPAAIVPKKLDLGGSTVVAIKK
jgi:hypothetical protein